MTVGVLFAAFVVLLLIEVPISVALVLAAAGTIALCTGYSQNITVQKIYTATEAFPLVAIPFFVMAGGIMGRGGMSRRLIALASSMVGNVRGGLAITSVIACMFFAAISGSTAATTAAIGIIMIPAIVKAGFSRPAATALQACAGSIGIIIPPSIPMVLMGYLLGASIARLFLAGVVPGMLIGLALMLVCYVAARLQRHPTSGHRFALGEMLPRLRDAVLPLLAVVFVIGGILFGIVTATEAGVVAVVYALLVSMLVYREMRWVELWPVLVDTAKITGIVVLCIGAASPFAWLLTVEQVPLRVSQSVLAATYDAGSGGHNVLAIKLVMIAILLLVGTFLDLTPAMLIFVPIFYPIAKQIAMDPVQFGTMVVCALGIGQCTPPVGIALYVACSVANTRMNDLFRPLIPFLLAMVAALLVTAFYSPATLWLPKWLLSR